MCPYFKYGNGRQKYYFPHISPNKKFSLLFFAFVPEYSLLASIVVTVPTCHVGDQIQFPNRNATWHLGFPGGSVVKNPPINERDAGDVSSVSGLGRPWRKEWQPTPVFLPGKFHGQRTEEPNGILSIGLQSQT